jgi:putative restriction endonuclease
VCRGYTLDSDHAPQRGYRYDGLYRIENYWTDEGIDGYKVWRYRLVRIFNDEQLTAESIITTPEGLERPGRSTVYTTRVIRNSEIGNYVKNLYNYTCQITGVSLETPSGQYAEACHIQPVGRPHNGPDIVENVLCLSPNMHVLFDFGAITLSNDFTLIGVDGELILHPVHNLSLECIRYHRVHIYNEH